MEVSVINVFPVLWCVLHEYLVSPVLAAYDWFNNSKPSNSRVGALSKMYFLGKMVSANHHSISKGTIQPFSGLVEIDELLRKVNLLYTTVRFSARAHAGVLSTWNVSPGTSYNFAFQT